MSRPPGTGSGKAGVPGVLLRRARLPEVEENRPRVRPPAASMSSAISSRYSGWRLSRPAGAGGWRCRGMPLRAWLNGEPRRSRATGAGWVRPRAWRWFPAGSAASAGSAIGQRGRVPTAGPSGRRSRRERGWRRSAPCALGGNRAWRRVRLTARGDAKSGGLPCAAREPHVLPVPEGCWTQRRIRSAVPVDFFEAGEASRRALAACGSSRGGSGSAEGRRGRRPGLRLRRWPADPADGRDGPAGCRRASTPTRQRSLRGVR